MKKYFILLQLFLVISQVYSQEPVQSVEPTLKENVNIIEFSIPFKKYIFDNGLTFIVNEDHSDQVVSIHLLFRIGSSASPADMNGMMNMVAKALFDNKNSEDFQLVRNYGGDYKYVLMQDYLSCLITVPKNIYQQVLWYQAQKLQNFLQNLQAAEFTSLKEKCIEEAVKSVSSPEQQGFVKGIKGYYTFGHPYSWQTCGDADKTEIIQLNDLKKFYHEWIGANNLIISLSGDLKSEEALKFTQQYFAKLPKVKATADLVSTSAFLADNPQETAADNQLYMNLFTENENFKTPVIYLFYRGVSYADPARHALNYAAYLLENKDYGLLFKALVESKLAKEVSVKNYSFRSGGIFVVKIVANGPYSLTLFRDTVNYFMQNTFGYVERADIKRLRDEKKSLSADGTVIDFNPEYSRLALIEELPFYRLRKLVELTMGTESTVKKSKILAFNELYYNNPNNITEEIRQLQNIAPQRVQKVCNEHLVNSKPIIVSVLNVEHARLQAGKENHSPQNLQTVIVHPTDEEVAKLTGESFAIKKPKTGKVSAYVPPQKEVTVLENGLKFSTIYHSESPVVNLLIAIDISDLLKQLPIPEIYNYFTTLMEERISIVQDGTLKEQLDVNGVKYNMFVENQVFYINMSFLNESLSFLKEFIREFLWMQIRVPVDIEKIARKINENRQPPDLSDYYALLKSTTGSNENIEFPEFVDPGHKNSFFILQINERLPMLITPAKTTVTITGNFRKGEINDFREIFRQWQSFVVPESNAILTNDSLKELKGNYFLTWKRQNNPKVLVRYASIPAGNNSGLIKMDFAGFLMTSTTSGFDAKNLTANTKFNEVKPLVFFTGKSYDYCFSTEIGEGNFILGLKEFESSVMKPAFNTIGKKEFKNYKTQFISTDFVRFQNDFHKSMLVNKMLSRDISSDFYLLKLKMLKKLKPSGLQQFAEEYITNDKKFILIVGNREQHFDNILNSGFSPLIEIDEKGSPVKKY